MAFSSSIVFFFFKQKTAYEVGIGDWSSDVCASDPLKVGDSVQVEGPYGSAPLRPDDDSPLVLVAGSSGLAPAKSIARTALMMQPDRRVHLYFGVRDEDHVYDEGPLQVLV